MFFVAPPHNPGFALGLHANASIAPPRVSSFDADADIVETRVSEVDIPFRIPLVAQPPRARRVLWDQFHSLRYPSGFFPRDNLETPNDLLDWVRALASA